MKVKKLRKQVRDKVLNRLCYIELFAEEQQGEQLK